MSILVVETSIKVNKLLKTEKFSSVGALDIFNSLSLAIEFKKNYVCCL